jgi:hypothetical protein
VDAAYGKHHIHDGKSHSEANTVLGAGRHLEAKQKNVTKSSTETELVVALSDYASRGINLKNFLRPMILWSGSSDHLSRQPELYGNNGARRTDLRKIKAYQHPILLAR